MGRAPNPGAPQRVSAHVVPKAPSFATYDEDEKTTIESGGWEEEASTTVEQGEVAEKVRALGLNVEQAARPNTSITSTNGHGMADEPTVDDQRANAAIALLPLPHLARLLITQGNDAGQAIEVRPGRTYTIGRALDNDLVLTDMTVSRKHFELRHENGAWVLADRGSGNGTLINTRLEDAPFTLANGDVIEIGNTAFRFELPNSVRRPPPTFDSGGDDDAEMSTMSGKPLQEPEPATPQQLVAPMSRPRTLPAPAALTRPRPSTRPPSYAIERPSPHPQSHPPLPATVISSASSPTLSPLQGGLPVHAQSPPATTLPLPQMANRPPLSPSALLESPHGAPQATLPGQGPPMHPAHPARLPFSYPSSSEIPKLRPRGSRAMAIVSAQPPRDAPSTAQVSPMAYPSRQPALAAQQVYVEPQLSRRTKMALAAAGVALFAAIATIAIIKGTASDGVHPPPVNGRGVVATAPIVEPIGESKPSRTVDPVETPAGTPTAPPATPPAATTEPSASPPRPSPATEPAPSTRTDTSAQAAPSSAPATPPVATSDPPPAGPSTPNAASAPAAPGAPVPAAIAPPATPSATTPSSTSSTTSHATTRSAVAPATTSPATTSHATTRSPATTRSAVAPATTPATTSHATTRSAVAPATTPATTSPATTTPATTPSSEPATPPTTRRAASVAAAPRTELPAPARSDKKPAKRPERRPEKRLAPSKVDARIEIERSDRAEPKVDKKPGRTTQAVKSDAGALYRAKNFNGAATLVTQSLSSFSGADVQELKSLAAIYSQFGKAYNIGMAPGTKFTDAYVALRRAVNYDRDVGSAYTSEIQDKLVVIASRAATQYMAAHDYEAAFQAVRVSESLGSTSPSNKTVRDKLESLADDLLRSAAGELASNPDEARRKARQVQGMVDPRSKRHERATKLLNGS